MKKNITLLFAALIGITSFISCENDNKDSKLSSQKFEPVAITKTNATKIYMHYMAWFESKESSGNNTWGYHWTMANKNPDNVDANGKREIAAHYYPLIGPYHSGDKSVLENHLLTMKYAGIDGLLIDWYGTHDLNDYKMIKDNTDELVAMLDKVGLEYAIVYEDRFLTNIVDAGLATTVVSAAKVDMAFLQSNYFNDSNYIKVNDKPLLLNFGPITMQTPDEWTNVFANVNPKPTFLTLWNESSDAGANASGEYAWVYENSTHLSNWYTNVFPNLGVAIGSAYPGFRDFYVEGGGGDAIGWTIEHNNGATLDETLSLAQTAGVEHLQLITWNDFGEGTMIEPTQEFGYTYVEKVKTFAGVTSTINVFSEITKLYNLRVSLKGDGVAQAKLDRVFGYFVSMQPEKAVDLLNDFE